MNTPVFISTWAIIIAMAPYQMFAADLPPYNTEIPMPASLKKINVAQSTLSYEAYNTRSWSEIPEKLLFYANDKPYYEFNNFYPAALSINGTIWPSSEHYFQAQKFPYHHDLQEQIRNCPTARLAYKLAQERKDFVRDNWHQINIDIMKQAVWAKFSQNKRLAAVLIATGNAVLIEDAGRHDAFFGAGENYKGKNYLGRILMLVRSELVR